MEALKHFFRSEPEGVYFVNYSSVHFIIIFIAIVGIYFLYRYKDHLQMGEKKKLIKSIIGTVLLLQQGILYLWYIFTGYSSIKESLPLYNCRVAIICTALALLTDRKFFKNIAVYWGVYGSILALAYVEGDPFAFPHYTGLSFFLGHIFLLWGTFFILLVDGYKLNKVNLKATIRFTTIYHLALLAFNLLIKANYDYLISPPFFQALAQDLPQIIYSFIAILAFDIFILGFYSIVKLMEKSKKIKKKGMAIPV